MIYARVLREEQVEHICLKGTEKEKQSPSERTFVSLGSEFWGKNIYIYIYIFLRMFIIITMDIKSYHIRIFHHH